VSVLVGVSLDEAVAGGVELGVSVGTAGVSVAMGGEVAVSVTLGVGLCVVVPVTALLGVFVGVTVAEEVGVNVGTSVAVGAMHAGMLKRHWLTSAIETCPSWFASQAGHWLSG
jgi:hypothetical protein